MNELFCPNLKLFKKGKVREVYDLGDKLLIVASDNISAFDVVLPNQIEGKGEILTQISNFWFDLFQDEIENHIISTNVNDFPQECQKYKSILAGRSILVKKAELIEVEAIVRGYLSGSGFKSYQETGQICGVELPEGLQNSSKLEEPIFTPTTKASEGHDENITIEELKSNFDQDLIEQIKKISIFIYQKAAKYALERGIIIADTKVEFGLLNGKLILIDEIFTPDSSRFWSAKEYRVGKEQDSYDKQIIRNYLNTLDWDKTYPGPKLPDDIIKNTISKYQKVYDILKSDI